MVRVTFQSTQLAKNQQLFTCIPLDFSKIHSMNLYEQLHNYSNELNIIDTEDDNIF